MWMCHTCECKQLAYMGREKLRSVCSDMQISPEGEPLQALYDANGSHVSAISAITESEGRLFFGNLAGEYVSFIATPVSD